MCPVLKRFNGWRWAEPRRGDFPDFGRADAGAAIAQTRVHMDCDLYVRMPRALDYFYDRMLPGGYLIVHDSCSLASQGAEQAVDEFFADKPGAVIMVGR